LIRAIQASRGSKVITYITSDRPMLSAHNSEDAVPLIHQHVLGFAPSEREKLDLVLYSRGAADEIVMTKAAELGPIDIMIASGPTIHPRRTRGYLFRSGM
jgi:hypothetical protein